MNALSGDRSKFEGDKRDLAIDKEIVKDGIEMGQDLTETYVGNTFDTQLYLLFQKFRRSPDPPPPAENAKDKRPSS